MRELFTPAICLALFAVGCGSGSNATSAITVPSPAPAPKPPPVLFAEPYMQIQVGDVVQGHVSANDPLCVEEPLWPCKYFRITPQSDGSLDVVMTHSQGNLDLSFRDSEGGRWWYPVKAPVKAGATYQITIWEYESPGVEFELRTSLQPF